MDLNESAKNLREKLSHIKPLKEIKIGNAKLCINCEAVHAENICPLCSSEANIFMQVAINHNPQ